MNTLHLNTAAATNSNTAIKTPTNDKNRTSPKDSANFKAAMAEAAEKNTTDKPTYQDIEKEQKLLMDFLATSGKLAKQAIDDMPKD